MRNTSFFLLIALSAASLANAGPLFPCVTAVSSKNGNFIAIVDGNKLNVVEKEQFINAGHRLNSSATFWSGGTRWSVIFDEKKMPNEPECPLPMITDDGEFLVLVAIGPVLGKDAYVLRIYRRRDHRGDPIREGQDHGIFIKSIRIDQIWPPDKVAANTHGWDDETPEWFAGGQTDFSFNNRELIHTTRWGQAVRIDLATGFVIPPRAP